MKKSIEIKRTAHYYLQHPIQPITSLLFVIHGYAQLAQDFLDDFLPIKDSGVLVIAPEALSKFYNKERKPVANWMTSHEREDEIIDYINYLNCLYSFVSTEYPNLPINVLGFSQGVSTLLRWITHSTIQPHNIHLCSGTIPPELTKKEFDHIRHSSYYYYYGSADRLLKEKEALNQIDFLSAFNLEVISHLFQGRHEISKECILNLTL